MANQFPTCLVLTLTHVLPLRNNKLRKATRARSSLGEVGKVLWLGFHSFVFDPYQFPLICPLLLSLLQKGQPSGLWINRCGHTNRKNEFGPLSNKNTITESLIPSHHSLDLVTPAFVAEALDSARDSSWTIPGLGGSWDSSNSPEAAVPSHRRSALFCFAQSAPFQLDRKALVIFLPWHFGGMLGEEILCDLPSHIVLRHKSKPKFGISIKPVLYRVAFQSFTIPSSLSLASPGNGLLNVASPESPLPLPWQTPKASIHLLVPAGVLTSRKWWGPDCFTAHLIWFPSVFASIHIKPIENCSKNTPRNKNSSRPIKRH